MTTPTPPDRGSTPPRDVVRARARTTNEKRETPSETVEDTVETPANVQVNGPPSDHRPEGQPAWEPNPNQRKPFEPGHTLSLVHGGESERVIEARAAEVRAQLLELAPWVDQPAFVPAVARYLRAEARELLIHEHITRVAAENGTDAVPQRLWESASACANVSMKASALLGLDPTSYAHLRAVTGHATATEASLVDRLADAAKVHAVSPTTQRATPGGESEADDQ